MPDNLTELRNLHDASSLGEWRAGTKVFRTLYRGDDLLGTLDHREDTKCVAAMHNALPAMLECIEAADALVACMPSGPVPDVVAGYHVRRQALDKVRLTGQPGAPETLESLARRVAMLEEKGK